MITNVLGTPVARCCAASIPDLSGDAAAGRRLILIGILVNAGLSAVKILAGLFGNSAALVADGLESTLDILSSTMIWAALKVAGKPADSTHPYGHGKVESLAAIAGSLVLIAAGLAVAVHSISSMLAMAGGADSEKEPAPFTLGVLAVAIITKEILFRVTSRKGRQIGSTALQADGWHHRSDAITSLAAFAGITLTLVGGPLFRPADHIAALFCCGIILFNGSRMLRSSLGDILDEQMPEELISRVLGLAKGTPGVTSVEKCRVRKSGLTRIADLHVRVDGSMTVRQGHNIAHAVKDGLEGAGLRLSDVTVHVEPEPPPPQSGGASGTADRRPAAEK